MGYMCVAFVVIYFQLFRFLALFKLRLKRTSFRQIPGVTGRGARQLGRSAPVSLIGLGYYFGFGKSTLVPTQTSIFLWYIKDFPYTTFLMPLNKKVKLASFQENMLSHKTVFLSLCRSLWEDKLFYTLVPATRLFLMRRVWPYHTALLNKRRIEYLLLLRKRLTVKWTKCLKMESFKSLSLLGALQLFW